MLADRDDLMAIDTATGKRRARVSHGIKKAAFAVLNESGAVVIGGSEEIAAFDSAGRKLWSGHYPPPGRGLLRTIGAIAARAASLYLRYGGTVSSVFRGFQVARALSSLSWSGLATRSSFSNLQTLVTNSAQSRISNRFKAFGVAARLRSRMSAPGGAGLPRPPGIPDASDVRNAVRDRLADRRPQNVQERLLDRLDPASQLDRLSRFLWHRERLATLRGNWMYFYTDLKIGGHGLAGINIQNGAMERQIKLSDLDERFVTDEVAGRLFAGNGNRLVGYTINQ